MSQIVKVENVKSILDSKKGIQIKERLSEILGNKSAGFISSMINVANSPNLKECEAMSIISSSVVAATLDLPIDPNIGFAYVVPYKCKDKKTGQWLKKAQFQLGYKGYVQLALRTSQYKNINIVEVYKGQLKSWNPLTEELEFDFSNKESDEVIGYAGFFRLVNGFEKTVYWGKEEVLNHAKKYSKSFNSGPWKDDFNSMAKKTVLKDMLKKWGILSIDMQTGIKADQAVIKEGIVNKDGALDENIEYVDNLQNVKNVDFEEVKDEIKQEANQEVIDIEAEPVQEDEDTPVVEAEIIEAEGEEDGDEPY